MEMSNESDAPIVTAAQVFTHLTSITRETREDHLLLIPRLVPSLPILVFEVHSNVDWYQSMSFSSSMNQSRWAFAKGKFEEEAVSTIQTIPILLKSSSPTINVASARSSLSNVFSLADSESQGSRAK